MIALIGLLAVTYPSAASWFAQANQSQVITNYLTEVHEVEPDRFAQLEAARNYNDALSSSAVLEPNTHLPSSGGSSSNTALEYDQMLMVNASGLMGRVQIPSIDVDLPIFHGTSDEVLLRGAGHLQGTSLPVGGESTHTVITAHRGLASATMFTNLNRVELGDTFTIGVFDEVLTYRVIETQVIAPTETEHLRVEAGRDLATLVTCTPLGINSHRIVVTGERVHPTPQSDIEQATSTPEIPRFPWWSVWLVSGLGLIAAYVWWAGRPQATHPPS